MARRRTNAAVRDAVRAVRGSLGRFLAIMGITALGCGFYAGLQMCGPDMRAAADAWYDGFNLWDLRLVSTLGWSEDDVGRISSLAGIEDVMPSVTVDAMAKLANEQVAVRISTLDMARADSAVAVSPTVMATTDGSYLNRVRLVEGRWPKSADECVISADKVIPGFGIGSRMGILATASGAEEVLSVDEFTVVGSVTTANYPYTGNFGSTTLGAGMVQQYAYVPPAAISDAGTYTEVFARVLGAQTPESESASYERVVEGVAGGVEARLDTLAEARLADVKGQAQEELDVRADEAAAAQAEARARLASGRSELDAAADELASGAARLAAGEADYERGLRAYWDERSNVEARMRAAQDELCLGAEDLAVGEARLSASAAKLADAEAELAEGQASYDAGRAELDAAQDRLAAGASELARQSEEMLAALAAKGLAASTLDEAQSSVASLLATLEGDVETLDALAADVSRLKATKAELVATSQQAAVWPDVYGRAAAELAALGYVVDEGPTAVFADIGGWVERVETWARETGVSGDAVGRATGLMEQAYHWYVLAQQAEVGLAEVERQEAALLEGLAAHGISAGSLDEAEGALVQARSSAVASQDELRAASAGIAQLKEAQAELDSRRDELAAGRAQLASVADELAAGRMRLAEGRARLEAGNAELAAAHARLQAGTDELARGRDEATRRFAEAEAQLAEGAATLEASRRQLEEGQASYEEGLAAWETGRIEAETAFAEANERLLDAQVAIDELAEPDVYVLDRTKNEGAATYHADTERMDAIAAVFPFMFFLVAALVALTTMTRMVEDERVQIGTYKALGYGTTAIAARYLAYAGAASISGAVVGVSILSQVLPTIVMSAYGVIYAVPSQGLPLPVSVPVALASAGLGVGVTLVATWGAVVATLRETPATLMLPRAPVAGRRILLERVGVVWRRLSFSWKVTFRNLFRYKRRLLMTVVGISGCTALLLVGFGLHDAIWDIIDCQYGPILHYDTTVGLDAQSEERDVDEVAAYLARTGEVTDVIRVHQANMQAAGIDASDTMRVQAIVPADADELPIAVTLRTRQTQEPLSFDDESVVVSEKLSMKYGLSAGDDVVLFEQDATGNAVGTGAALRITGVTENYVGNLVYVGRDAWARVDDGEPVYSTLYASTTAGDSIRTPIAATLHDMPHVSTVAFSDETINVYRTMLSVVDMIVVVLIVSAGALAFIVLYNLTNINVAERVREIASLKVLGFTRREVYAYIFREVFLLAALGAGMGMVLGTYLATFVITTAEVDYVMFGRSIHAASYAYAFVLTMVFTAAIAFVMRRKLDHVDMVESLKSVE